MAKIAQLLPNCVSDYLIFEWKPNSYCPTIIGVSFAVPAEAFLKKKLLITESIRPLG